MALYKFRIIMCTILHRHYKLCPVIYAYQVRERVIPYVCLPAWNTQPENNRHDKR